MAATDEIVVGCGDIYIADVGTAFPDVDTVPGAGWTLLGATGNENYDEDGVVLSFERTKERFLPAGSTIPRKEYITEVVATLTANLVDLTAVTWAQLMDDATVTQTAAATGTPGYDEFALPTGSSPTQYAVLFRGTGLSPAVADLNLDIRLWRASQAASQEIAFKKAPAMLRVEFTPLYDANGFIDILIQTAAAL